MQGILRFAQDDRVRFKMPDIRHSFHQTRGFATHVAEAGDGPPLVLLHGWPEFWAAWEPLFARLGDRYRLIAPDYR